MNSDQTIRLASGLTVGFADHGRPGDTAVIWCHGGPGSRLEPAYVAPSAVDAGLRIVGIDRPGYGLSTRNRAAPSGAGSRMPWLLLIISGSTSS